MVMDSGLNVEPNLRESTSLRGNVEAEKSPDMIGHQKGLEKSGGDQSTKTVPFLKLFSFADTRDVCLMIVGIIGAIGNGLGLPLMTVFFGEMINVLGSNQHNKDVVRVVSKVKICSTSLTHDVNFNLLHWKYVAECLTLS